MLRVRWKAIQAMRWCLHGFPLGPTYADGFLSYHEKKWLDECPEDIKPLKYRRYVDDIFVLCRDRDHHKKFLEHMNTKYESISFTDELRNNNKLPFLDFLVTRTDDGFVTDLYRKVHSAVSSQISLVFFQFNSKRVLYILCYFVISS